MTNVNWKILHFFKYDREKKKLIEYNIHGIVESEESMTNEFTYEIKLKKEKEVKGKTSM